MTTTTIEPATQTLEVPGATLTYDVRRNGESTEPPLMLIGSPMAAAGFVTLGESLHRPHPRHVRPTRQRAERARTDPDGPITPESTPTTSIG